MDADVLADHQRRNALTTILGNAQMLQRRIIRAAGLTPGEREILLQEIAAIEQATQALHQELATLSPRTEES